MKILEERGFHSVTISLIGAGSGGGSPQRVSDIISAELAAIASPTDVYVVHYTK